MATFIKLKDFGSFGNIGSDELKLALVQVDRFPPRLHVGRWSADGRHVRFSGFITEEQAQALGEIISKTDLHI